VRRGSVAQLVAIGIVCGGIAALVAIFIPWLPDPASRQAGRIDFVFWFVTVICIAIFALVAAVIIYALVNFRAQPGEDMDGPPIHGHTGLEIVWTAVPAALVTAISIVSAIVLAKNDHIPKAAAAGDPLKPLLVDVTAQQFAWSFEYPAFGKLKSATLKLPLRAPVELRITSLDVTHSFWVPEFGQKQDAVPGSTTKLVITPDKNGTYPVICTELCGLGHAVMRSRAEVMPAQQFLSWAKGQQQQQEEAAAPPERPSSPTTAARAATRSPRPERTRRSGPTSITSARRRSAPVSRWSSSSASRSSTRRRTWSPGSRTSCRPRSRASRRPSSTRS
jgi:cytochrome c oxidase subunit 2